MRSMPWLVGVALVTVACLDRSRVEPPPEEEAFHLSVSASPGMNFKLHHWTLEVDAAGRAVLHVSDDLPVRRWTLPPRDLADFRHALVQEDFFSLDPVLGVLEGETESRDITVTLGERTHTVSVYHLVLDGEPSLRVARLWRMIRGWFEHPTAADLRPSDQDLVFDAAAAAGR